MGINTGTPGFDIDGKAYTYDIGDADRPEDPNYPIPADKGDITVDQNEPPTKDLSKTTKKTLASYLGRQTQLNYYRIDTTPVGPDASGYVSSDINVPGRTNETPRIPAPQETTRNSEWFTKGKKTIGGTTSDSPTLRNWKIGTEFTSPDPTLANLQKGKTTGAAQGSLSGNELLPNIDKSDPNNPESFPSPKLGALETYTNAVLKNNRFTNTSRYVARSLDNGQVDNSPASQTAYLDDLSQDGRYNPTFYHPVYGNITAGRMAQLGVSLPARSSGEWFSTDEGKNPTDQYAALEAVIPGISQLGAKVELKVLQAADVLQSLTQQEIPEEQYTNIAEFGSWGSLNNQFDPFSGLTSLGMTALSLALVNGVGIALAGLGALFEGLKAGTGLVFGNPEHLLGIVKTKNQYMKAVYEGVTILFGIQTGGIGSLTSTYKNGISFSQTKSSLSGFEAILARTVIRSSVVIAAAIKRIGKSEGVVSGVQNVLSTIELIRTSKILGAMNALATIGDASLSKNYIDKVVPGTNGLVVSKELKDSDFTKVKNKKGEETKKLNWATDRTPTMYLIPKSTQGLSLLTENLGSFKVGPPKDGEFETRTYYNIVDNKRQTQQEKNKLNSSSRISAEEVRKLENELEAEYVPFYFHDIRTNEIVSFHAFIESIGDDYSASYDSIDAFGRVEPIRIYKGTQRKISLTFIIAATSSSDFQEMWAKINKLTTLVYPQYTEGRRQQTEINGNKYNFVQPFSQMIGAAPLIRIRLGNLLRSNYSRFALARLFGADLPESKFGTENSITRLENAAEKYQKEIDSLIENAKNTTDPNNFWNLEEGGIGKVGNRNLPLNATGVTPGQINNADNLVLRYQEFEKIPVKIVRIREDGKYVIEVIPFNEVLNSGYWGASGMSAEAQSDLYRELSERYANSNDNLFYIEGGRYLTVGSNLKPSEFLKRRLIQKILSGLEVSDTASGLDEFLDPEKNALVKSFKSSGGKGLAGFIESMNLDWQDKRWDVTADASAPMMCKVTISFSPIHDISPGLDSQGYNRAPIYPVGPFKHSNDDKG